MKHIVALLLVSASFVATANVEPCHTDNLTDPIRCGYLWSD